MDENDNPPKFDKRNYTFFVSENADDDTIITTIHASDIDINRTISYGLLNNDNGSYSASFEIESQTGKCTMLTAVKCYHYNRFWG